MLNLSENRKNHMIRCYHCCEALTYVLRERFNYIRSHDKNFKGLSEIDADKTMRFCYKLCTAPGTENKIKSFSLNPDFNDKHGNRVAFALPSPFGVGEEKRFKPLLYEIEVFDQDCPSSRRLLLPHKIDSAWGGFDVFEPQVDAARLLPLINKGLLAEDDIRLLGQIGRSCGILDEREMIALGRHENAGKTLESILWEIRRWNEWTSESFERLDEFLQSGSYGIDYVSKLLWNSWSYSRECAIKSGVLEGEFLSDRSSYISGIKKLRDPSYATPSSILSLVNSVQRDEKRIWDDARISVLGFTCFCCWSFSNYFIGTLFYADPFNRSSHASRLSSVTTSDVMKNHQYVSKCVTVVQDQRPTKFSIAALNGSATELRAGFTKIPSPSELWGKQIKIERFVSDAKKVWNWIKQNVVDPDLESSKGTQEA